MNNFIVYILRSLFVWNDSSCTRCTARCAKPEEGIYEKKIHFCIEELAKIPYYSCV